MIQAPADIVAAVHLPVVRKRIRVKWAFRDGNTVDLTDRVSRVGAVTRTLRPLLKGYTSSNLGLTIFNGDNLFHPTAAGSRLSQLTPEDYIGSELTLEQGIHGGTTGWHYLPVYAGPMTSISYADETAELRASDSISRLLAVALKEDVTLDHRDTPSQQLQDLITDPELTSLTAADLSQPSWDFADAVQEELMWKTYGKLPSGSTLFRVASDLARSGGGVMWPDESGLIHYDTEFPNATGDILRGIEILPTVFHPGSPTRGGANSASFRFHRNEGGTAAEIVAKFMGVSTPTISFDRRDKLGFLSRKTLNCPYLTTMRCADLLSRIVYEGVAGYVDVIKWSTHGLGLLAQLNDRVRVILPGEDAPTTYRLTSKQWSREWMVLEAVKESHLATIIEAALAVWGDTDWGDSTRKLL